MEITYVRKIHITEEEVLEALQRYLEDEKVNGVIMALQVLANQNDDFKGIEVIVEKED
ncbi:hypothetical protein Kirov_148 [Bacillus phage Kirov]|uniref:Uncharacterized protein n=1 Tax=Bacillus phage Kirov TaxID=2783539 RepID=A0A7U3NKH6_9CAUD|nr:hypothetical protein PQE67_gp156 [Bacillus phage Kirov]QOV08347.1 hypothetical protein Kirov_148 [Bacillus phage Kirov]